MSLAPSDRVGPAHLIGWKEIADALGKSVRTVQRWERELGLPVRRLRTSETGHSVYAEPAELEAWLARQSAGALAEDEAHPEERDAEASTADPTPPGGRRATAGWAAAVALALVAAVALVWKLAEPIGTPAGALAAAGPRPLAADAAIRPDSNDLLYVTDDIGVVVLNGRTLDPDPIDVITIPADASFASLVVSSPSPDRRLLLTPTRNGSGVAVFDLTTHRFHSWFAIPRLLRLSRARLSPDGATLVAVEQDGRVHALDATTGLERWTVPLVGQNFDGSFDHTGRFFLVPNRNAGTVSVIDVAKGRVIGRIETGDGAHNIVISPDGGRGFVTNAYAASVSCVDLVTKQVIDTIEAGEGPYEIAMSLDGQTVYVGNRDDRSLDVIAADACRSRQRLPNVLGGARPGPIAVSNDGSRVYVAALDEPFIGVFDTTCPDLRPVGPIPLRTVASSILPGPLAPVVPAANGSSDGDCESPSTRTSPTRPQPSR